LYQLNQLHIFSLFFSPVGFTSAKLALSPPFSLPGAASPTADVVRPPCHVALPFHWAKTSSLPPLHLSAMICPIASPLKPKLKHWICITATGYPPRTTWLSPSSTIKKIILSLTTLPNTQLRLYFASSLAGAPSHRSSTRHHRSLSPLSHTHHPSAQRHPQWRTSRLSIASRTVYQHVNSR
jgi:hypothetical protein